MLGLRIEIEIGTRIGILRKTLRVLITQIQELTSLKVITKETIIIKIEIEIEIETRIKKIMLN